MVRLHATQCVRGRFGSQHRLDDCAQARVVPTSAPAAQPDAAVHWGRGAGTQRVVARTPCHPVGLPRLRVSLAAIELRQRLPPPNTPNHRPRYWLWRRWAWHQQGHLRSARPRIARLRGAFLLAIICLPCEQLTAFLDARNPFPPHRASSCRALSSAPIVRQATSVQHSTYGGSRAPVIAVVSKTDRQMKPGLAGSVPLGVVPARA